MKKPVNKLLKAHRNGKAKAPINRLTQAIMVKEEAGRPVNAIAALRIKERWKLEKVSEQAGLKPDQVPIQETNPPADKPKRKFRKTKPAILTVWGETEQAKVLADHRQTVDKQSALIDKQSAWIDSVVKRQDELGDVLKTLLAKQVVVDRTNELLTAVLALLAKPAPKDRSEEILASMLAVLTTLSKSSDKGSVKTARRTGDGWVIETKELTDATEPTQQPG